MSRSHVIEWASEIESRPEVYPIARILEPTQLVFAY